MIARSYVRASKARGAAQLALGALEVVRAGENHFERATCPRRIVLRKRKLRMRANDRQVIVRLMERLPQGAARVVLGLDKIDAKGGIGEHGPSIG